MDEVKKLKGYRIKDKIAESVKKKTSHIDETPHLAIIFVGSSKPSQVFIRNKKKFSESVGTETTVFKFDEDAEESEVIEKIRELNRDDGVHGILVQLPLPAHIDEDRIFSTISPEKDVDCLTPENLGRVMRGTESVRPCAVEAVMLFLEELDIDLEGKEVAVVNNSNLIGKPLSMILTRHFATVTICHKMTRDLKEHTKDADIVVTAVGKPGLITGDILRKGSVVIDAGYARSDGEACGDLDEETARGKLKYYTPVPGGVGPVTVAVTIKNLLNCYRIQKSGAGEA